MALDLQTARLALRGAVERWFEQPGAAVLDRLGFTANSATLAGLALAGGAAYLAAIGSFVLAGGLVLIGAAFDLLDGALARRSGLVGPRGALLDSVADRVSEGALFLGLLVYYTLPDTDRQLGAVLAFVAFAGSIMVSYVRARAEGLGLKGTAGFLTRPERVAIAAGALLAGQPLVLLWILAVGTPLSAVERFRAVWRLAGRQSGPRQEERHGSEPPPAT